MAHSLDSKHHYEAPWQTRHGANRGVFVVFRSAGRKASELQQLA
ncbi:hypothetical protein HMPREF9997_02527 [Corynebacterium durum F0235]|uniref:Uncharacterized protein n=1 Tax=Corynebacterium durum F0235 TaxID=1035195 RepID=L1M9M2_9CORY|nr:hypothetical protein HMPREF9997_02527 [Corynebacterium durum F0235]